MKYPFTDDYPHDDDCPCGFCDDVPPGTDHLADEERAQSEHNTGKLHA